VKLGILGGAFNPPHYGHLRAALEAKEGLGLEKVLLIPSGHHPFKGSDVLAAPNHRLAMTTLACAADPGLEPCAIEVVQATTTFTIDTLETLSQHYPDQELVFLMGSDLMNELHLWKSWHRLLDVAHLCQMTRPGSCTKNTEIAQETQEWLRHHHRPNLTSIPQNQGSRFGFLQWPITQLAISSSDIRLRVQSGKSIRFLTTESVIDYIHHHGLYHNTVQSP